MYLLLNDVYVSVTGVLFNREGERVILFNPSSFDYITNPKNKINSIKFTDILSGKEISLGILVLESLCTKGNLY
jgi:hypothetical protein